MSLKTMRLLFPQAWKDCGTPIVIDVYSEAVQRSRISETLRKKAADLRPVKPLTGKMIFVHTFCLSIGYCNCTFPEKSQMEMLYLSSIFQVTTDALTHTDQRRSSISKWSPGYCCHYGDNNKYPTIWKQEKQNWNKQIKRAFTI